MDTQPIRGKPAGQRRMAFEPGLSVLVALELLFLFVITPLAEMQMFDPWISDVAAAMVIAAGVAVVSRHPVAVGAIVLAALVAGATSLLPNRMPTIATIYLHASSMLVFVVTLIVVVGSTVFAAGQVTMYRVQGAVVLYLKIAMMFAIADELLAQVVHGAFNPPDGPGAITGGSRALYFSLVTLTSTGYGDIVPVHPLARSLANLEALIGQLFPATLLARLVSLEVASRR